MYTHFDWFYQISVEHELTASRSETVDTVSTLHTEFPLGLYCGSQALRLLIAWFKMWLQDSLSSLESADNRCLMMVLGPCLTTIRDSWSSFLAGLLVSKSIVCILEQISLGHNSTVSVTNLPRSMEPMGACLFSSSGYPSKPMCSQKDGTISYARLQIQKHHQT